MSTFWSSHCHPPSLSQHETLTPLSTNSPSLLAPACEEASFLYQALVWKICPHERWPHAGHFNCCIVSYLTVWEFVYASTQHWTFRVASNFPQKEPWYRSNSGHNFTTGVRNSLGYGPGRGRWHRGVRLSTSARRCQIVLQRLYRELFLHTSPVTCDRSYCFTPICRH